MSLLSEKAPRHLGNFSTLEKQVSGDTSNENRAHSKEYSDPMTEGSAYEALGWTRRKSKPLQYMTGNQSLKKKKEQFFLHVWNAYVQGFNNLVPLYYNSIKYSVRLF